MLIVKICIFICQSTTEISRKHIYYSIKYTEKLQYKVQLTAVLSANIVKPRVSLCYQHHHCTWLFIASAFTCCKQQTDADAAQ